MQCKVGCILLMIGSALIFVSFTLVGALLILFAIIIISIVAYAVRQNKIQNWMRRCILSMGLSITHFKDYAQQTAELKGIFS